MIIFLAELMGLETQRRGQGKNHWEERMKESRVRRITFRAALALDQYKTVTFSLVWARVCCDTVASSLAWGCPLLVEYQMVEVRTVTLESA